MVGSLDRRVAAGISAAGIGAVLLVNPTINGMSVVPACPLKSLTGLDCPLCGGTRAARSLLTGDVPAALDHNVVVTAGLLLGAIVGLWWLAAWALPRLPAAPVAKVASSRTLVLFGAVLAVFWVARNLPFVPYLQSGVG